MTPADGLIQAALRELAPASLLVLGGPEPDGVKAWRQEQRQRPQASVTVIEALPAGGDADALLSQRYAAALVLGIDRLPDDTARSTIAALRDRFCDAVLVVVPDEHWVVTDWLALGFEASARCEHDGRTVVLYRYDVATFNPEREWNNPQDWAHPENFRRYRW
jgi:hypothetical protein